MYITGLNTTPPVAFHVQRSSSFINTPPINLEFDRVRYQIGGFWNTPANMFIAPVKGVYVFYLNIMLFNPSSGNAHVGIMHDGNIIQQAFAVAQSPPYSQYRSASASAVVEMEPLDQVYCRLLGGQLYGNSYYPVHFVGYLLYSLE